MTISDRLSLFVEPRIQLRGLQYFRDNRVSLLACHGEAAEALVSGTELYTVRLVREAERLRASCSCPFFKDRSRPCKHVWAAILAADARHGLRGGDGRLPQRLVAGGTNAAKPEPRQANRSKPPAHAWRKIIDLISEPDRRAPSEAAEMVYVVNAHESRKSQQISLEIWLSRRKVDGTLGARRWAQLTRADIPDLPNPADRQILSLLAGAEEANPYLRRSILRGAREMVSTKNLLPELTAGMLLPILCSTGRCRLQKDPESEDLGEPLTWDEGAPWKLWLELREKAPHRWALQGSLRRDKTRLNLTEPDILLAGLVFTEGRVGRTEVDDCGWIPLLRNAGPVPVPAADLEELLERIFACPEIPHLDLPEPLQVQESRPAPRPLLRLLAPIPGSSPLRAELSFFYEGHELPAGATRRALYLRDDRRLILRDIEAERAAVELLRHLGSRHSDDGSLLIHPSRVPKIVDKLLAEGWMVEAQGKLHRPLLELQPVVSSGIDWFHLRADARFEGASAGLQQILDALKRKTMFVPLGDGSVGVLPKEWLRRLSLLSALGRIEGDKLVFRGAGTVLLDAWIEDYPQTTWDETFDRARRRLRSSKGVSEAAAPPGFLGELRGYQRAGLGWLQSLRDLGFGGCLADDMGLGKTVQVLALLEALRAQRKRKRLPPSFVVVPRSLIFNWLSEAARFTPKLRVLNYTGTGRRELEDPFAGYDVVLTTYGTLRRDVEVLKQVEFDYLILDEAQAIKNAESQTARAARRLRGSHRLALSGTPVENHLGELWSLLAFLNPGLIEASPLLSEHTDELRDPSPQTRDLLARAVRPFFLRRTKEQVAPELPVRLEQTLVVELPPKQRRLYDELRGRFQKTLAKRIAEQGLGRTKILFLEALLRLRQAACHPGLLDPKRANEPCAKLDLLLPQLQEILAEGHKALVFSQFTAFLGLLRRQLDREGIPYLYLDGRTRNRQEKVEQFQSDPAFPLFLISLKAGGLGLNLTAADYVYLLDPWWNPAVEAQAIDRAHRIGQTRPVFASRLVARDTVEEKILELQKSKRELADAIIQADKSLLAALSREDLELLLS